MNIPSIVSSSLNRVGLLDAALKTGLACMNYVVVTKQNKISTKLDIRVKIIVSFSLFELHLDTEQLPSGVAYATSLDLKFVL